MSDDTPTQRLPQNEAGDELVEERKKSRALLFVLIGVGAALLVAIIVLLIILFGGGGGTPSADPTASNTPSATPTQSDSPTPSATPTPTPTPEPVPVVTVTAAPPQNPDDGNVRITSFSISPTTCNTPGEPVTLHVSWKSSNGNIAYFGVNTTDAQSGGMGWDLPATGDDGDFPSGYSPYSVTCPDDKASYTITVVGNGSKASKTVTLKAQ